MSERVDRWGALASSLCATHCALSALLPLALSALGLGFLFGHVAEWIFTFIAIAFAFGASVLGWRQHRSVRVVGLRALGIVGLLASRGLEMGSAHHDHHGDAHAAPLKRVGAHGQDTTHKTEKHAAAHGTGATAPHHGHEDTAHIAGTVVGVLAGLLLLFGHILNIRTSRRREEACCT